jgi:hypothetical protein
VTRGRRLVAAMASTFVLAALLTLPVAASAFTFSDGIEATCSTGDGIVSENYHPADDPMAPGGFIAITHFDPSHGWITDWNLLLLSSAPDEVHDFVFFHECAHAKTGTFDEVKANCVGLVDMRAQGRAGPAVEARLAAFHKRLGDMGPQYGPGKEFWAKTVACANRAAGKPAAHVAPTGRTPRPDPSR